MEYDIKEIYETDISNKANIVEMAPPKGCEDLCVFGVLKTKRGLGIKKEMLSWLTKYYKVYCVEQELPGDLYEYPALRFAQYLSEKTGKVVLYLHTKGAVRLDPRQKLIRALWKEEFTVHKKEYLGMISSGKCEVALPFTGYGKQTWFNGFYTSKDAFEKIGKIHPSKHRWDFERLFKYSDVKVLGRIYNDINNPGNGKDDTRIKMHNYVKKHCSGKEDVKLKFDEFYRR